MPSLSLLMALSTSLSVIPSPVFSWARKFGKLPPLLLQVLVPGRDSLEVHLILLFLLLDALLCWFL